MVEYLRTGGNGFDGGADPPRAGGFCKIVRCSWWQRQSEFGIRHLLVCWILKLSLEITISPNKEISRYFYLEMGPRALAHRSGIADRDNLPNHKKPGLFKVGKK
jgi:hypothetical protein